MKPASPRRFDATLQQLGRSSLAWRFAGSVLAFSLLITLLATGLNLALDYRREVRAVETRLHWVGQAFGHSLGLSLWNLDQRDARLQLQGILRLPDIESVQLLDEAGQAFLEDGHPQARQRLSQRFELYGPAESRGQHVGSVLIAGSLDEALQRVAERSFTTLLSQGVQIFALSAFILLLFHGLIGRHLANVASHLHQLRAERSAAPLRLGRRWRARRHDELDLLEQTINEMQQRLRDSHARVELAAQVFEQAGEGLVVTDAGHRIVAVNPAFTQVTGYSEAEALGHTPALLRSGQHEPGFYADMARQISQTGRWEGEICNRRKTGELYVEWLTVSTIYAADGSVHRHIGLFVDITRRKQDEQLIWRQANFDVVTGLPNRSMFAERLRLELAKSQRSNQPFALLFIDLDHFKEVNDTLGHSAGDALLHEAAARLQHCVRETDIVARLGGDEFTVILAELGEPVQIERIATDILQQLARPFAIAGTEVYLSASIGITVFPLDGADAELLMKNADQAMYAAKAEGRNRCQFYTPAMQESAQRRMALASDLRAALPLRQFALHYQPVVSLLDGRAHKAEALLRWQHPERGAVSPALFIPLAEESGLIHELGDWVFREATAFAAHLRAAGHAQLQIAINTSPQQYRGGGTLFQDWLAQLKQLGLPGEAIVIEITEGLLMDDQAGTNEHLLRFRDAGIQVAIDDFGTGYSSLSYLKKFDIDLLKIDQSFVRHLQPGSDDLVLCEAMIAMAHQLGLKVVAEGIETEQQRALLAAAGCDYGQGYLFARPMPAPDFERWLAGPAAPTRRG
ncbi:EAL domain-containing protein [Pelomonas sp. V22]|uniref:bifunctional diguanylate cyclase/phosphodiesterase n=1 Tax=Pelomonas sp. V22 TaxID=2822139 RepID=UPI0024A7F610|nr:EAL domain-containing protein [Pelomonas sp. V22]MDI4634999.1 EAL domain-containing protein [Pelomonas sp. V22]